MAESGAMEAIASAGETELISTYSRAERCRSTRFTKETAAEAGRRSAIARKNRIEAAKERRREIVRQAQPTAEEERRLQVSRQIALIDLQINEHADNPEMLVKLTTAKARLWELVFPKPGQIKQPLARPKKAPAIAPLD